MSWPCTGWFGSGSALPGVWVLSRAGYPCAKITALNVYGALTMSHVPGLAVHIDYTVKYSLPCDNNQNAIT